MRTSEMTRETKILILKQILSTFFKEVYGNKTGAFVCGYQGLRVNGIQPIKLSSLETSLIPLDKFFTALIGGGLLGQKVNPTIIRKFNTRRPRTELIRQCDAIGVVSCHCAFRCYHAWTVSLWLYILFVSVFLVCLDLG